MDTAITTIYCLTDDWPGARHHHESAQRKVVDAEIMTVALTAARYFGGNFETAWDHLLGYGYLNDRLSRGRFNRRLHALAPLLETFFQWLGRLWRQVGDASVFLIDSFPVAVCDTIRIGRCRIYPSEATDDAYRGYIASKRRYFYGLKVHMLTNKQGRPVALRPGSYNDTKELRNFEFDLPAGSVVYGDKAYNEYFTEDLLADACAIELLPLRKKNSKRKVPAYVEYIQRTYRKQIETSFSLFKQMLPKSIHAVTAKGFELKVFLFLLAYSLDGLL